MFIKFRGMLSTRSLFGQKGQSSKWFDLPAELKIVIISLLVQGKSMKLRTNSTQLSIKQNRGERRDVQAVLFVSKFFVSSAEFGAAVFSTRYVFRAFPGADFCLEGPWKSSWTSLYSSHTHWIRYLELKSGFKAHKKNGRDNFDDFDYNSLRAMLTAMPALMQVDVVYPTTYKISIYVTDVYWLDWNLQEFAMQPSRLHARYSAFEGFRRLTEPILAKLVYGSAKSTQDLRQSWYTLAQMLAEKNIQLQAKFIVEFYETMTDDNWTPPENVRVLFEFNTGCLSFSWWTTWKFYTSPAYEKFWKVVEQHQAELQAQGRPTNGIERSVVTLPY